MPGVPAPGHVHTGHRPHARQAPGWSSGRPLGPPGSPPAGVPDLLLHHQLQWGWAKHRWLRRAALPALLEQTYWHDRDRWGASHGAAGGSPSPPPSRLLSLWCFVTPAQPALLDPLTPSLCPVSVRVLQSGQRAGRWHLGWLWSPWRVAGRTCASCHEVGLERRPGCCTALWEKILEYQGQASTVFLVSLPRACAGVLWSLGDSVQSPVLWRRLSTAPWTPVTPPGCLRTCKPSERPPVPLREWGRGSGRSGGAPVRGHSRGQVVEGHSSICGGERWSLAQLGEGTQEPPGSGGGRKQPRRGVGLGESFQTPECELGGAQGQVRICWDPTPSRKRQPRPNQGLVFPFSPEITHASIRCGSPTSAGQAVSPADSVGRSPCGGSEVAAQGQAVPAAWRLPGGGDWGRTEEARP